MGAHAVPASGGRAIRDAQQAMRDEAGVDFGFLGWRRVVMPFYLSTGGFRSTPRNGVCLAWTREPSGCPTTDRFPYALPNPTRASGPTAKSIYGVRP